MAIKTFKINDHISLKLIGGKTRIYLDGKEFIQCKYLLMSIPKKNYTDFDKIESIDEAINLYKEKHGRKEPRANISPEQEFIGHCSNLQAWVENDYDPRILHTQISYPLLRDLAIKGDKRAIYRLRECIIERLSCKNKNALIQYLEDDEVIHFFTLEELELFYEELDPKYQSLLQKLNKLINRKRIIDNYKRIGKISIPVEDSDWGKR